LLKLLGLDIFTPVEKIDVTAPCKHAGMCQHCAGTGLMLAASAQYRRSAGMFT